MSKKKGVFNVIFLIVIFLATVYYVFHEEDIGELLDYIQMADARCWIFAIALVIMFILGESVIIHYLFKTVGQHIKFKRCCLYSFVGFFFSSITPSATGGQPMQIVYMKKDDIPVALSSYLLVLVTIGYKMVLVLLGLAILIVRPIKIMMYLEPVKGWCILGIVLNVIVVGGMFLLLFNTRLAEMILRGILWLGLKIHVFKNREKWERSIRSLVERYDHVSEYLTQNPRVAFNVLGLSIIQRFLLFAVTAVVYLSFGLQGTSLVTIILLQGMISVAVDMLPTPGGMGVSEGLFLSIFESVFGEFTLPGMVVSRGISFYSQLFICMIMTVVAHFIILDNRKKG